MLRLSLISVKSTLPVERENYIKDPILSYRGSLVTCIELDVQADLCPGTTALITCQVARVGSLSFPVTKPWTCGNETCPFALGLSLQAFSGGLWLPTGNETCPFALGLSLQAFSGGLWLPTGSLRVKHKCRRGRVGGMLLVGTSSHG